jgi:hypothetical protein
MKERHPDSSHGQFCKIILISFVSFGSLHLHAATGAQQSKKIDFNREVRPIFSEHCYTCHGPDEQKRKAGLRLDVQEEAFKELKSGNYALVAGNTEKSALLSRITSTDPDEMMPPPKHNKPLKPEQIAILKKWVQEGAQWKKHWAFISPERPKVPAVKDRSWPLNSIDYFTLARLEKENLKPNPEADKATLIRRLTFDLTGLPPTVSEVDAFLADKSARAYEKLVDKLLASPHYGERMAQNWLDLARFADTSGYHFDGVRFMWLWRDWVIQAFNENKPYDQFTLEQLAGDLFPKPTQAQRIATGFVRNNMTNDEGGADPDEYLNEYVVDRVNTLGVAWLGLTVGCTQCHDHKYDPLKTKEFYRLYAFFHNVPEKGLDRIRTDNPPPRLPVPTPAQAMAFVEADFALKDAEKTLADRSNELGETQEKWERETNDKPPAKLNLEGLLATVTFDDSLAISSHSITEGKMIDAEKPEFATGLVGKALKLEGKAYVDLGSLVAFDFTNSFSYGSWVRLEGDGTIISKMEKGPGFRGFDLLISGERLEAHLVHAWPDVAIKVRSKEKFPRNQWLHLLATYDGSAKASGLKLFVNGRLRELEIEKDQLTNSISNNEPVRIGARNGDVLVKGLVDDVRFYNRTLSDEDARLLVLHGYLPIITKSRGKRNEEERNSLQRFYKENYAVDYLRSDKALAQARKRKEDSYKQIPTTLIMEEMNPPRETFLLVRGDFRIKGEKVTAGTPAVLPPLPEGPVNRLTLARWLVSKEHPLMARVTVNRYWAMLFGTGLVKTVNDFGSQGEWPSHPELLDWLAVQFRDGGDVLVKKRRDQDSVDAWDVKALVRLMVTSATYRQSAAATPDKLERDPYNRLFTRGPRMRLEAEFVRDNALAVGGLLNAKIGGPSVKPYQPPGIWDGVDAKYEQDKGEDLYRRGMYVFWRRSAHYPSFATFDAPSREVCTSLRQRTQTPLQSLVLMNDPVYVEAARGLAQRVLKEEPNDPDKRLVRAFRHTLGRVPETDEVSVLQKTYRQQLAQFRQTPEAAKDLIKIGESPAPEKVDAAELAAMMTVANVLLNLNETICK